MSEIKRFIEVKPPVLIRETRVEKIILNAYACPACNGNGWHLGDRFERNADNVPCEFCKGSGRLDAVVTIKWVAGKKEK